MWGWRTGDWGLGTKGELVLEEAGLCCLVEIVEKIECVAFRITTHSLLLQQNQYIPPLNTPYTISVDKAASLLELSLSFLVVNTCWRTPVCSVVHVLVN